MPKIILLEEYEMKSSGVKKPAGTVLTFTRSAPEMKEILSAGKGEMERGLPPDLPGIENFKKAGFTSLQSLSVLENWGDVKGVGPKTAKELDEYFQPKNQKGE